jgi:hypothetical protein
LVGNKLAIRDLYLVASRIRNESWVEDEPAIDIMARVVDCPPFQEQRILLASVGLHALGRRYQRAGADAEVYADLRAIGRDCLRSIAAGVPEENTEFAIETTAGGCWRGALNGALVIRTYV